MTTLPSPLGRARLYSALGFAAASAAVIHFAWIPSARLSGVAPLLTISAGLAHGAAGALMGARLFDRSRTRTGVQAGLIGACVSLLALAFFSPAFALWISSENVNWSLLSYLGLVPLVAFFTFLAAGWAVMIASAGVGWALFRFARPG